MSWKSIIGVILMISIVILMVSAGTSDNSVKVEKRRKGELEKEILDKLLEIGYDKRLRPKGADKNGTDGPVNVTVNILIRSISKIDDVNMEYGVQITFREQWNDHRLQYGEEYESILPFLALPDPDRLWKPDLFFINEKRGRFHKIIMPNVLLRIYPNGNVLYSVRLSLVLACPMTLHFYPMDRQICIISMTSYGYTTDDIVFFWKDTDPVQVRKPLNLPTFKLKETTTSYCTSRTNTGEYSCLKLELHFKREFSYYLIQIYIPSIMLVIVSWVSFWLDQEAVTARVVLGVTTLLTMAKQTSGVNAKLPPVSYTKAIDVWANCCLTFAFGALLEFAIVNYVSREEAAKKRKKKKLEPGNGEMDPAFNEDGGASFAMKPLVRNFPGNGQNKQRKCDMDTRPRDLFCIKWIMKYPTLSKRIDICSRLCFPMTFMLFNLAYWLAYAF